MAETLSPLRYPGGKSLLYPFVSLLISDNNLKGCTYVEPFAGGAGLALKLLFNDFANHIVINDFDPAIFSFWNSVLNRTSDFIYLIEHTPVTINEWYSQREIYANHGDGDLLYYGFSTFFLNRTNVSGIIKGGVIGGVSQTGSYKIDARFNKEKLVEKIQNIANYKNQISLFNMDAIDFIYDIIPKYNNTFTNFDPPYVCKGSYLYTNFYKDEDHKVLHEAIIRCPDPWMLTYDDCLLIRKIYSNQTLYHLPIKYSAGSTKSTKEIGIFSRNIKTPENMEMVQNNI